jgi:hypothetical protein
MHPSSKEFRARMRAPWLPSSWSDESKDVLASNDAPASDDAAAQGLASNDAPVDTLASDEATMGKPPPPEAQPANPRSEPNKGEKNPGGYQRR